MSKDDPKKHRVDRRFLSAQPHEIAYVRRKLARENPGHGPARILEVIHAARAAVAPSESRTLVMAVCHFMLNPPPLPPAPRAPKGKGKRKR